ncbi:MAG TPA: capsule assembly Wzi family protein [Gemmatimonadaceae bacterium]
MGRVRIRRGVAAALAAALALVAGSARAARAQQHPLVTLPLDDPAYVQLDALVDMGCGAARVSAFRPYMVKDVRHAIGAASAPGAARACGGAILAALRERFAAAPDSAPRDGFTAGAEATLRATGLSGGEFRPLWRDIRGTGAGDPAAVGIARARLSWSGGPDIVAVSEAYAETDRRNDPTVRAKQLRRTSGVIDFSEAYLAGRVGRLVVSAGRVRDAWLGAGDESIVLSANGPALDRIALAAQWTHFEFRAFVGSVDDVVLTPGVDGYADSLGARRYHRMMAGHALTWRPSSRLELTLGETGLFPRQGGGMDLAAANPFMVFQVTQNDQGRNTDPAANANLTAFGSLRASAGRASLQGDLLIDDIQIDARDRKRFPDLLAWNVRASVALPVARPAALGAEYRRVGSFTYLETYYTDTWQHYGEPVGSELGPDADMARLFGEVWPSGRLRLSAGVARWRRGANRIGERPVPSRADHAGDPFPDTTTARPAVQRAWLGDAGIEWMHPVFPVRLTVEGARVTNAGNVVAPARTLARVQLVASWRFRYP